MSFSMIPSCRSLGSALVSADRGGTVRVWIVFCTGLLAGCVGESSLPAVSGPYDQAFSEEFRVELDTIPVATMGQVSEVLVLDDRILVTDQMSDRVVAFSLEGAFAGAVGRHGEGPGEFQNPRSLVEASDGTILVSDVSPRLTRLGTSLELLDVFTVPEWPWVGRLDRVGEDVKARVRTSTAGRSTTAWKALSTSGATWCFPCRTGMQRGRPTSQRLPITSSSPTT